MSWKPEVDAIRRRRELAAEHGGSEAVERHHQRGRLTVRERIDALVDRGSFREHGGIAGVSVNGEDGALTSFTPANTVTGVASKANNYIINFKDPAFRAFYFTGTTGSSTTLLRHRSLPTT